jgi:TolA-binding protein
MGEVLLKDKFLTQAAPDICRKLQKSVAESEKSSDQLMQLAMSVYQKREKKIKKHHDLISALSALPDGS